MQWLNINRDTLGAPEFAIADPIDRATWLCLLEYCAGQENGGLIRNCRDWSDNEWRQLARVEKAHIERPSKLLIWKGQSLRVWAYPIDAEEKVKSNRSRGHASAVKRWGSTPEHAKGKEKGKPCKKRVPWDGLGGATKDGRRTLVTPPE